MFPYNYIICVKLFIFSHFIYLFLAKILINVDGKGNILSFLEFCGDRAVLKNLLKIRMLVKQCHNYTLYKKL